MGRPGWQLMLLWDPGGALRKMQVNEPAIRQTSTRGIDTEDRRDGSYAKDVHLQLMML